jgi:hypothetical protein
MFNYVVLIPGGFKPPTVAHYEMIRSYSEWPTVRSVHVVQTSHVREGYGPECTKPVFEWYGGFNEKVSFILDKDAKKGAVAKVHELVNDIRFTSQYATDTIYTLGVGNKGKDAKRIENFLKYYAKYPSKRPPGVRLGHPPFIYEVCIKSGQEVSSTELRQALREGDDVKVGSLIPRHRSPRNFPRNFSS